MTKQLEERFKFDRLLSYVIGITLLEIVILTLYTLAIIFGKIV